MTYRIVWKRKNTQYVEYLDLKGLTKCLKFLEEHNDYELVSVTWDE